MLRILNAEPAGYCDAARTILRGMGQLDEGPFDRAGLLGAVPKYEILIVRLQHRIDRGLLDAAVKLRIMATATTGLDHIDIEYAQARGVQVLSLRGERDFLRSIPATAEMTWGLLLALVRRIPAACAAVQAGRWERDAFRGHDLRGRRLGLVGLGRIGEQVARYGAAFGMSVAAFDPHRDGWLDGVRRCATLAELMAESDAVSVHVPLNEATRHLINRDALQRMPAGAVLVNTARGDCLDEEALVDALEAGRLAGAALDVITEERGGAPLPARRVLRYAQSHDNLLITPHLGGATVESMAATEVFMAEKIRRALRALPTEGGP